MTVQELIDQLKQYNADRPVVLEKNLQPITNAYAKPISLPPAMADCCGGDSGVRIVVALTVEEQQKDR